jgi:hypothetical protein
MRGWDVGGCGGRGGETFRAFKKMASLHTASPNVLTLLGCIQTESGAEFFDGNDNNRCVQYVWTVTYSLEEMICSSLLTWIGVCRFNLLRSLYEIVLFRSSAPLKALKWTQKTKHVCFYNNLNNRNSKVLKVVLFAEVTLIRVSIYLRYKCVLYMSEQHFKAIYIYIFIN